MDRIGKIATWLAKVNLSQGGFGPDGGGLTLKSREPATKATEVIKRYPVNSESDVQALAQEISLDAEFDAEGAGNGTHYYVIFAERSGEREHFARLQFLIPVESPEATVGEEATSRGLLAQNQRHLEALMKVHTQGLPTLMHGYHQVLSVLSTRLEGYEKTHSELMTMLRDVVKQGAELEVDAMSKIKREERIDMLIQEFGPVIVQKLLAAVNPESSAALAEVTGAPTP